VLALARDGFDVVVNTRSDVEQAEKVAAEARGLVSQRRGRRGRVRSGGRRAAVRGRRRLGSLRVLVNNAAVRTRVPVYDVTAADWEAVRQ